MAQDEAQQPAATKPLPQAPKLRFTFAEKNPVTNPVWSNADHTLILCQVTFNEDVAPDLPGGKPMAYDVSGVDPELHAQQLWKDLNAGTYGAIGAYVAPPPTPPKPPGTAPKVL